MKTIKQLKSLNKFVVTRETEVGREDWPSIRQAWLDSFAKIEKESGITVTKDDDNGLTFSNGQFIKAPKQPKKQKATVTVRSSEFTYQLEDGTVSHGSIPKIPELTRDNDGNITGWVTTTYGGGKITYTIS